MSEKTHTLRRVTTLRTRTLTRISAVGLGIVGGLLGSGVLLVIALGLAVFCAGRWLRASPVLLCVLAGCTTLTTRPPLAGIEPRRVGVTAHLAEGNPAALPAAVAAALDANAELAFRYKEHAHQDDNQVPGPVVLILSPVFLLGMPTGGYTVTASAELVVSRGSDEVAHYQAEAVASRVYGFYYGSTLRELEAQARTQVRHAIDEALYRNADQLAAVTAKP